MSLNLLVSNPNWSSLEEELNKKIQICHKNLEVCPLDQAPKYQGEVAAYRKILGIKTKIKNRTGEY